ncbi:MAG: hypothetical protein WDW38_000220 [Sanguina aurantia]
MKIDHRRLSEAEVQAAHKCAHILAERNNLTGVYVATDEEKERTSVIEGVHPGFVTMAIKPLNVDTIEGTGEKPRQQFLETVSEFLILARSKCIVMSKSGFSDAAQMMGGQDCWTQMDHCHKVMLEMHEVTT